MVNRCAWVQGEQMATYHDAEWGVPVHDDKLLFEMLILEGAQAGLSWATILKRRETYRKAFDNFDVKKISQYREEKKKMLLLDEGIIRNRLKIEATINNAGSFIRIQEEFGSFDAYLWKFVGNKPIINHILSIKDIPAKSDLSDKISSDLKSRGFTFVGSTIIYAFMQAVGIVNDHSGDCFRKEQISKKS